MVEDPSGRLDLRYARFVTATYDGNLGTPESSSEPTLIKRYVIFAAFKAPASTPSQSRCPQAGHAAITHPPCSICSTTCSQAAPAVSLGYFLRLSLGTDHETTPRIRPRTSKLSTLLNSELLPTRVPPAYLEGALVVPKIDLYF